MPYMEMTHSVDPRNEISEKLGALDGFEVFNNQVLVAIYQRPEKTAKGIILPDTTRQEDQHQGKVGLVVRRGPSAFDAEGGEWFKDMTVEAGDWVVFRPSDGWPVNVKGVACRLVPDTSIRARVASPDMVW